MIFLLVVYHRENTVELTLVYMFSNCIIEPSQTCPNTQDVYTHSIGTERKARIKIRTLTVRGGAHLRNPFELVVLA